MKLDLIYKGVLYAVLTTFAVGCGGGGSSASSNEAGATAVVDPIAQRIISNELNATMQESLNATIADIEAKLSATSFYDGANASSGVNAAPSVSRESEYHLADVIFTLGTDDLRDTDANELKANAAYNYFKTYVADAGKLSAEDEAEFRLTSIQDFNEAFVAGYYEGASEKIGAAAATSSYAAAMASLPVYNGGVSTSAGQPKRIFGFFFKMFNPMTYIGFMMDIAKSVMNAVLAQAFKMMLLSGTMTKMMLRLALKFPILTNVMISVLSSNWGITRQMIPYLKYDKEFGELFMQLAYEQPKMAHFVFQNIDAPLYYGMSVAMTLSKETTERLAVMMNWYASIYFVAPQPASRYNNFVRLLLNTGQSVDVDGETNHGDGNELANEKLFYALFQYPFATKQFIAAMEQLEVPMRTALMDHIFLGQQQNPTDGSLVVDDPIQGTYNIFAIAQGMLKGIESEGFGASLQNFMDFAMLIPEQRYLPYAQKFAMVGFSYYIQNLPADAPDEQKTMQAFMQFLMGSISQALSQVDAAYAEQAQAFGQMLQNLQPYIDEFMQNGMANISQAPLDQGVPDVTQINGNGIDETINDPLEQDAPNPPAPSSLIDIIENFPLLWEKDYSNGAYKGEHLSRYNNGKVWEAMSTQLSELHWMDVPSSANFTYSSRFNFIFEQGSVDMYIISNALSMYWEFGGYSLTDTGESVSVRDTNFNQLDDFNPYRVYKVTIPAGYSLGNLHILMQDADGVAFDISGTKSEPVVLVPDPVEPPAPTDPVDANGSVVDPVEPPVVLVPQSVDMTQVINGFPSAWEKDYSNGAYTSGLVYKPWTNGEQWAAMPEWLSNIQWMEIPQNTYFSSSDNFDFYFSQGSVDMYLVSTHSNLPWLLDMNELTAVDTSAMPIESTYNGMTFYLFKRTIPAGYRLEKLWLMMNNISGIAFDTSNVTP